MTTSSDAEDLASVVNRGFFDLDVAREHMRRRRSEIGIIEAGKAAHDADPTCSTGEQHGRKLVPPAASRICLTSNEIHGFAGSSRKMEVDRLDEAREDDFYRVDLVFEQFNGRLGQDWHKKSLHPVVGTSDGRGHPAPAQAETAGRGGSRAWSRCARLVLGLPYLAVAVIVLAWWKLTLRHARGEETLAEAALGAGLIFLITWLALLYTGDV